MKPPHFVILAFVSTVIPSYDQNKSTNTTIASSIFETERQESKLKFQK